MIEPIFFEIFTSIIKKTKKNYFLEDEHINNILNIIKSRINSPNVKIKKSENLNLLTRIKKFVVLFLRNNLNFYIIKYQYY